MTATFTRASTAFRQDGVSVASGAPRFEPTRIPGARWRDTFDTDQISTHYTSGGDTPATWSVSGGILSATGGVQATLLRTGLTIADGEIIANVDQAHDGGLIVRHVDNNNYYLLALYDDSGIVPAENLRIFRRVTGTFTQIAQANVVWPRGTAVQIRFRFNGSLLEAWFNDTRVIAVTDTNFASGSVGMRNSHATATRFLDFAVHQITPAIHLEEGTTNLLTANQASVETDLTGIAINASGTTVTRDTTHFWHGVASIRTDTVGTQAFEGFRTNDLMSVTPSQTYTFSVWIRGSGNIDVAIQEFTAAGGLVGGTHRSLLATPTWTKHSVTRTFGATGERMHVLVLTNAAQAVTFWADGLQLEQKPFATSWHLPGTSRVAETLTIPSAGVFTRGNWAVEGIYTPQIPMNVGNVDKTLFAYEIDGNNWLRLRVGVNGEWNFAVMSGGVQRTISSANNAVLQGAPYYWTISGDGTNMRLFVNGAQIGTDTTYTEPVGTMPTNLFVGSRPAGTLQTNGFIDDLRISSRARTLAEHQAVFNSGSLIFGDESVTRLYRFNGTLEQPPAYNFTGLAPVLVVPVSPKVFLITFVTSTPVLVIPSATVAAVLPNVFEYFASTPVIVRADAALLTAQNYTGLTVITCVFSSARTWDEISASTAITDTTEFVPLGTFWSGEWHAPSEKLYVSTTGRDRLELLRKSTYSTSQVLVNQSLHALAVGILTDAGLTAAEYWIDPALQSIVVPNAWFGTLSHREALRQIAEASLGQVYADRLGVIRVEGAGYLEGHAVQEMAITADNYFRKDTPVRWGELANRVEVETQPLRAVDVAQEVFRSNEPVSIAAGQTMTLTAFYNEPPVIEAVASLVDAPVGAVITATIFYAWGASVTVNSPNAGTFVLVINGRPLRVLNKERAVAEDATSIRDHGLLRYEFPANHLVQSLSQAQMIAATLLNLYRHPRRDLVMDWRGNPALELGDSVVVSDHGEQLRYWVIKQDIQYDGALSANLEGRLRRV